MDRQDKIIPTSGQRTSTLVLWIILFGIVLVAATVFIALTVKFGSIDLFIQEVIKASLQARYDRIVSAQSTWSWSFGIFISVFLAILVFVLLVVLYTTLLERKLIGWFQIRQGPNRVGPWGLLQPFADMVKLLIKEDIVPRRADKWLHLIAPLIIFIPTLLAFVAIPFGKGTVELPQTLVSPTFELLLVEWIPSEYAAERGLDSPGYLEAEVAIETSKETHKTWWVPYELDHDPIFVPADSDGFPLDKRYRLFGMPVTHEFKPVNPGQDKPVYGTYVRLFDLETPGRRYDVLEISFDGVSGHNGIVELGLQGTLIDKVESEFSSMVAGIGEDVAPDAMFDFGNRSPKEYIDLLFNEFADSVAVNNRNFSADSMVPAFGFIGEKRSDWRDLYTPDFDRNKIFYLYGAVDRVEEKASLYFYPHARGNPADQEEPDIESLKWSDTGAAFRLQRIAGAGYSIEKPDGTKAELRKLGDSVTLPIGSNTVTLKLKNTQFYNIYLIGKDLGVGIVYIMAVTSLAVLGIFMAGFGSNNKWSLYGAIRSVAQLMSYEVPMTLAVLGPVLLTGSLSMVDIVESQHTAWFVVPQFFAFYTFLACMTAEVNRSPFDLPEAESELVAGFHTEYSGLKFGFFFLAEYANMFIAAALMTTLFFGGWVGPFQIPFLGEFLSSFFWFVVKCVFWLGVFVWFRATFPRFRIDQMMDYAWKILLPIALVNVIFTGYIAFSDIHMTGDFTIWKENNWRIWDYYIKALFTHVYTRNYAVPAILIIGVLIAYEWFGYWLIPKVVVFLKLVIYRFIQKIAGLFERRR